MWTTTVTWSESNLGTERGGLKVGRAAEFMPGTRYQFIEHIGEPAPAGDYPLGNVDAIEPIMTLQMSRQQLGGGNRSDAGFHDVTDACQSPS
jgi:hypothetical protein